MSCEGAEGQGASPTMPLRMVLGKTSRCMDRLKNPGYFVIVPSFSRTPILIARGSHRYIWQTTAQKKLMQEECPVEMIFIPPWSIFIGAETCGTLAQHSRTALIQISRERVCFCDTTCTWFERMSLFVTRSLSRPSTPQLRLSEAAKVLTGRQQPQTDYEQADSSSQYSIPALCDALLTPLCFSSTFPAILSDFD